MEGSLESTGAKERRVELRAEVSGAHHEHHLLVRARVSLGIEAVELHEELQQPRLAFLRGAVHVAVEGARAADGVELVDEDDSRGHLPRALEQVPHPLRRDTHEHLDKLRAVGVEKRNPSLARDSLGEKGLASTGRALEEHTFGDAELSARRAQLGRYPVLSILDSLRSLLLGVLCEDLVHQVLPLLPLLLGLRDEHVGIQHQQVGTLRRDPRHEPVSRLHLRRAFGHVLNILNQLSNARVLLRLQIDVSLDLFDVLHRPPRELLDELFLRLGPHGGIVKFGNLLESLGDLFFLVHAFLVIFGVLELLELLHDLDDVPELLHDVVHAGDVLEGEPREAPLLVLVRNLAADHLRLALPKLLHHVNLGLLLGNELTVEHLLVKPFQRREGLLPLNLAPLGVLRLVEVPADHVKGEDGPRVRKHVDDRLVVPFQVDKLRAPGTVQSKLRRLVISEDPRALVELRQLVDVPDGVARDLALEPLLPYRPAHLLTRLGDLGDHRGALVVVQQSPDLAVHHQLHKLGVRHLAVNLGFHPELFP